MSVNIVLLGLTTKVAVTCCQCAPCLPNVALILSDALIRCLVHGVVEVAVAAEAPILRRNPSVLSE